MASSDRKKGGPKAAALAVRVDGKDLPEVEARALWAAFSEAMEASRGDTKPFAASRGFASVAPVYEKGRAVLVIQSAPPGAPSEGVEP